jgi:hypothetical protein
VGGICAPARGTAEQRALCQGPKQARPLLAQTWPALLMAAQDHRTGRRSGAGVSVLRQIGIGIGHANKLGVQTRFVMVRIAAIGVKKEPSDPPQST